MRLKNIKDLNKYWKNHLIISFYSNFNADLDFLVKILFFPIGLIDIRVFLNFVKKPKTFYSYKIL